MFFFLKILLRFFRNEWRSSNQSRNIPDLLYNSFRILILNFQKCFILQVEVGGGAAWINDEKIFIEFFQIEKLIKKGNP